MLVEIRRTNETNVMLHSVNYDLVRKTKNRSQKTTQCMRNSIKILEFESDFEGLDNSFVPDSEFGS